MGELVFHHTVKIKKPQQGPGLRTVAHEEDEPEVFGHTASASTQPTRLNREASLLQEETWAQRGQVSCRRSHSCSVEESEPASKGWKSRVSFICAQLLKLTSRQALRFIRL